jgi:SAM-dependent methyltransferase
MNNNASFPRDAFEQLTNYEADNWWFCSRNSLLEWLISTYTTKAGKYLEIGCGTGFVLKMIDSQFPDFEVNGSELYEDGLEYARSRVPGAKLKQYDARNIKERESYEVIGAYDVLEHIEQDSLVLDNIYSALKPHGKMILTIPQHQWLWSASDEYANHVRRYSRQEILAKVRAAGFKIEFCSSFVSFLLPLMFLSRTTESRTDEYDPKKEFEIPGWLNKSLNKIMMLELFLIKKGIKFPCGGSLVVVGEK